MNEYQQILQQLQKRESDLLEMWDTMNPDSVEDTERAEKLYQKYLKQMHELSNRADAGELFEYLIPKLTISIHIDVVNKLARMPLPKAEKIINLIIDKDGAEAIDDEIIMRIFSFKDSKASLIKLFQSGGEVGDTSVEEKIFDTRDKEIISAYLNTRPKLSQRATTWVLKQPEAVKILIDNLTKNWPTRRCQEIIFSGLKKKEKTALLCSMVKSMPQKEWMLDKEGISISRDGELLIFFLKNGKEIWNQYWSKGHPSSFAIWIAKRKGWI